MSDPNSIRLVRLPVGLVALAMVESNALSQRCLVAEQCSEVWYHGGGVACGCGSSRIDQDEQFYDLVVNVAWLARFQDERRL